MSSTPALKALVFQQLLESYVHPFSKPSISNTNLHTYTRGAKPAPKPKLAQAPAPAARRSATPSDGVAAPNGGRRVVDAGGDNVVPPPERGRILDHAAPWLTRERERALLETSEASAAVRRCKLTLQVDVAS